MLDEPRPAITRRDLLALIGAAAGGTVMYQAMTSLGHAAKSESIGKLVGPTSACGPSGEATAAGE